MVEIPEWAMEEAGRLTNKTPQYSRQVLDVARALLAAERRGIERAAKVAAQFVDARLYKPRFPACSYHAAEIAAAIRQLGDTP